jgi:hypothetical protein
MKMPNSFAMIGLTCEELTIAQTLVSVMRTNPEQVARLIASLGSVNCWRLPGFVAASGRQVHLADTGCSIDADPTRKRHRSELA